MLDELRAAFRARSRSPRARSAIWIIVAAAATATISACSVSEIMSPRPDVEVGIRSAAIFRPAPMPEPAAIPGPATIPGPAVIAGPTAIPGGLQRLVPSDPYLVGYPRLDDPLSEPAEPPLVMPADEVACRRELDRLGVRYRDLAPINDGGACRIDYPVQVSGFSGDIAMKPAATLSCAMALTFARWTRSELAPAARTRYFSGVKTIHQGSSYSCRRIRGSGTMSEHAKGNALDVMRIELKSGRDIDVRRPGWFAFRQRGFLNNVRADGCDYFTTVLGPGYDADHKDHFHFDIKERRNGHRACR